MTRISSWIYLGLDALKDSLQYFFAVKAASGSWYNACTNMGLKVRPPLSPGENDELSPTKLSYSIHIGIDRNSHTVIWDLFQLKYTPKPLKFFQVHSRQPATYV